MATVTKVIKKGEKISKEAIEEVKKLEDREIVFDDDCPELTLEQIEIMAEAARQKRLAEKKEVVAIRISPDTLKKAKATGKGYTGFLSRLLDAAINDPEIVKKCL